MRRTSKLGATAGLTLGLLGAGAASAQTASPDKAPTSLQDGGQDGGSDLSTKLSRSGGVITPKSDVDPGIGKSAPDPRPNSTPVIPPSANGGGSAK